MQLNSRSLIYMATIDQIIWLHILIKNPKFQWSVVYILNVKESWMIDNLDNIIVSTTDLYITGLLARA